MGLGNLSTIYSFINKYLLARYYVTNIILGAWVTVMNTTKSLYVGSLYSGGEDQW